MKRKKNCVKKIRKEKKIMKIWMIKPKRNCVNFIRKKKS